MAKTEKGIGNGVIVLFFCLFFLALKKNKTCLKTFFIKLIKLSEILILIRKSFNIRLIRKDFNIRKACLLKKQFFLFTSLDVTRSFRLHDRNPVGSGYRSFS